MGKMNQKETLADKIAKVLSTTPASLDPEDELADETRAKLNTRTNEDEDDSNDGLLGQFRRQNVDLLADIDERYAGKKSSRKRFDDSDDDQQQISSDDDDDGTGHLSEESDEEITQYKNESADEGESDGESEEGESDIEGGLPEAETSDKFEHMKTENVPQQIKKGVCVRNQLSIWESLLEMRIQLQKCLAAANRMPKSEKFKEIKTESRQEFSNKVSETAGSVSMLLGKLVDLQSLVLSKYPETKKLMKDGGKVDEDPGDEEIPSDTEEDVPGEDSDAEAKEHPKKRRKIGEFEAEIGKQHSTYKDYRNSVIRKWHDKTTISIMKSNTSQYSVINNIEHTLKDKSKLVKRTQLKRTDYKVIGEEKPELSPDEPSDAKPSGEYNPEIFDDDDFYHQLLRELIEVKSSDITDPVQLGRQWIQLQNMRSKMKRKIDTRATKGRKTRNAVHTKLVSYLAPIESNSWTDESKTDLCSSLFGKNQNVSTS